MNANINANIKQLDRRERLQFAVILSIFSIALAAGAQSGSELGNVTFFGTTGQGDAAIVAANTQDLADNSCVPTADANGMTYLENYYEVTEDESLFGTTPSTPAEVNKLITGMGTTVDGTSVNGEFNGLQGYLSANPAPNVRVTGQYASITPAGWVTPPATFTPGANVISLAPNTTPTAAYLAGKLNANDGVEIGVQWGTYDGTTFTAGNGAHQLTLEQISLNGNSGTITVLDPWGDGNQNFPNAANNGADQVTGLLNLVNGYLVVTFDNSYVGPEPGGNDNPNTGFASGQGYGVQYAQILEDTVEYAVPEPSTYSYFVTGAMLFIPFARNSVRKLRAQL